MRGEHTRRAVALLLCLLAIAVAIWGLVTAGSRTPTLASVPVYSIGTVNPNITNILQAMLPTVTELNPNGGLTAGGNHVVITGTNFDGATKVTFGGAEAAFHVDSDTQITATAPAHSAGTVSVLVTGSLGGTSKDTSADHYTYVAPPATTAPPATAAPTTAPPATAAPTTAPATAASTATTVGGGGGGGGLSSGWIAFIVVIALIALAALVAVVYTLGRGSRRGGPQS